MCFSVTFGPNVSFESLAFKDDNFTEVNKHWLAINISAYATHMENWLQVFPMQQILIVESSELVAHPAAQLQRVEKFLNLQPFFANDSFYLNDTKGFMCYKSSLDVSGYCLGRTKGRKHPKINDMAQKMLRKYYKPFNELFFLQTGTTFNWTAQ
jgi:[heparan sulfate]-glucosamine 3-sulfotransferase 3